MRPCNHETIVAGCGACRQWSRCPEHYALWEGLPAPPVPDCILDLRDEGRKVEWQDPGMVAMLAAAYHRPIPPTRAGKSARVALRRNPMIRWWWRRFLCPRP
jgi:hypothetical protein